MSNVVNVSTVENVSPSSPEKHRSIVSPSLEAQNRSGQHKPRQPSKSSILSFLHSTLQHHNLDVRLNVEIPPDSALPRRTFEIDIAVFNSDGRPFLLLLAYEHASNAYHLIDGRERFLVNFDRADTLANQFRLPVDVICGMKAAKAYIGGHNFSSPSLTKPYRVIG